LEASPGKVYNSIPTLESAGHYSLVVGIIVCSSISIFPVLHIISPCAGHNPLSASLSLTAFVACRSSLRLFISSHSPLIYATVLHVFKPTCTFLVGCQNSSALTCTSSPEHRHPCLSLLSLILAICASFLRTRTRTLTFFL
jgi:hypothetical protein